MARKPGDMQYALQNARHKIDGYYFPTHLESLTQAGRVAAFERAKAECVKNLRADMDFIESMTAEMHWPKMAREGGAA